jgi:pSer/pThr/pTyr-binding forkhead associated (FHA) protein
LVDQTLLALQVAFVVLLYLFIWRVIRVASRDVAVGQESMVLTPVHPAKEKQRRAGRLVVAQSTEMAAGTVFAVEDQLLAGRADDAQIRLGGDGYASGHHARFMRVHDGDVVVEDLGSTNGTFVNGEQLHGQRPLRPGDVVTIGQTELTYETGR